MKIQHIARVFMEIIHKALPKHPWEQIMIMHNLLLKSLNILTEKFELILVVLEIAVVHLHVFLCLLCKQYRVSYTLCITKPSGGICCITNTVIR